MTNTRKIQTKPSCSEQVLRSVSAKRLFGGTPSLQGTRAGGKKTPAYRKHRRRGRPQAEKSRRGLKWHVDHSPTSRVNSSLHLSQFDYHLPSELIAQAPADTRRGSRLLHLDAESALHDRLFADLPSLLRPHDLLVLNNTQVIKARLRGRKDSGANAEILVARITDPTTALAHVKASKSPKAGARLHLAGDAFTVEVTGRREELSELEFPA